MLSDESSEHITPPEVLAVGALKKLHAIARRMVANDMATLCTKAYVLVGRSTGSLCCEMKDKHCQCSRLGTKGMCCFAAQSSARVFMHGFSR